MILFEEMTMNTDIYVCLDLGNDTLKISFAYENGQHETYGKLNAPDLLNQVAYPAAAFYDTEAGRWLFAEELEEGENTNFSTVVKIKELLSLIVKHEDPEIEARNAEYYRNGCCFPQFSFPVRHKIGKDFQYFVDNKLVFEVPAYTPMRVCEEFFAHIKEQIKQRIKEFSVASGVKFKPLRNITIVHPPKLGREYVDELYRLIEHAFGFKPVKDITSTQALGLFAYHKKLLTTRDRVLLFDMGDETLSVAKVWCNEVGRKYADKVRKMGILMDSPSAHAAPLDLGGSNIDEAINAHLDRSIYHRETMGSPSSDHIEHIFEDGLCAHQYLLMKDIKKAKMLMQLTGEEMFRHGVPISIRRETMIQRLLTPTDFFGCVGTNAPIGTESIAQKVLDYILGEMNLFANRDVTKILLAGGMAETFGLVPYLKNALHAKYPRVEIKTFENNVNDNDPFRIQFYEMSTYAAAVGGAVVAMKDYSVDAVLSYSYGTWLYQKNQKCLVLFADRGDLLLRDENPFKIVAGFDLSPMDLDVVDGDEIFSTFMTTEDIENRRYSDVLTYEDGMPVIGEDANSPERLAAKKAIDLKVVSGGPSTEIRFFYQGNRVAISGYEGQRIYFEEGFIVDKNGIAKPFLNNYEPENNEFVMARPLNTKVLGSGSSIRVRAKDIEFRLTMKEIEVETNQ